EKIRVSSTSNMTVASATRNSAGSSPRGRTATEFTGGGILLLCSACMLADVSPQAPGLRCAHCRFRGRRELGRGVTPQQRAGSGQGDRGEIADRGRRPPRRWKQASEQATLPELGVGAPCLVSR